MKGMGVHLRRENGMEMRLTDTDLGRKGYQSS